MTQSLSKRFTAAVILLVAAVLFFVYAYYQEANSAVSRQFVSVCQSSTPSEKGLSTTTNGTFVYVTPSIATTTLISSCDTSASSAYSLDLVAVSSSSAPTGSNPPTIFAIREFSNDGVTWFPFTASSATFSNASSSQTSFANASTTEVAWRIGSEGGNLDATSTIHIPLVWSISRFTRVRIWAADGSAAMWGVLQKAESD